MISIDSIKSVPKAFYNRRFILMAACWLNHPQEGDNLDYAAVTEFNYKFVCKLKTKSLS